MLTLAHAVRFARQLRFKFILKLIRKQKRKLLIWLRKLLKGRRKGLIRESLKWRLIKLFINFMIFYDLTEEEVGIIEEK